MSRLSISTWTLHPLLGRAWYEPDGKGRLSNRSPERPSMDLLEVPAAAARHGIRTIEVCHFHIPNVESRYLSDLRSAVDDAGVELFSVLIDAGDIAHPDPATRSRDRRMVREWLVRAAACGASHVRVIAGDQEPSESSVALSVEGLTDLSREASDLGLRVITENFKKLCRRPSALLKILSGCGEEVGLCADFGNFPRETRTSDLAAILPEADSIHAKADYDDRGQMDEAGFRRCVALAVASGFNGPISLIHQDRGDTWQAVEEMKAIVTEVL